MNLFTIICVLAIVIIMFFVGFKEDNDDYYGGESSIIGRIFTGFVAAIAGLIVSGIIVLALDFFSSNYSTMYIDKVDTIEIYALSNSSRLEHTLFASYDREYVYYNRKDKDGYIYTAKEKMDDVKFKIASDTVTNPHLEIHRRKMKRYSWGKLFFNGDSYESDSRNPRVFVLNKNQISSEVLYNISNY